MFSLRSKSQAVFSASARNARLYSTPVKPSVKLIAEIRKHTQTSLVKAREALAATNNDLDAALEWLQKDLTVSGAQKAAKLEGRTTEQGLIAIAVLSKGGWKVGCSGGAPKALGTRAAMIELNCETDFVARNDLFRQLAQDISHTAAFISEASTSGGVNSGGLITDIPLDLLQDAPLMSHIPSSSSPASSHNNVSSAIRDTIAKIGEKISLRRVCTLVSDPLTDPTYGLSLASYVHGSSGVSHVQAGRLGSLIALGLKSHALPNLQQTDVFAKDFNSLSTSLARQVVGLDTTSIRTAGAVPEKGVDDSSVLYEQPFVMRTDEGGSSDESVGHALSGWSVDKGLRASGEAAGQPEGVEVVDLRKWVVGESIA